MKLVESAPVWLAARRLEEEGMYHVLYYATPADVKQHKGGVSIFSTWWDQTLFQYVSEQRFLKTHSHLFNGVRNPILEVDFPQRDLLRAYLEYIHLKLSQNDEVDASEEASL